MKRAGQLFFYRYELAPGISGRFDLKPREGALLRVECEGEVGFSDLHPWPELGDPPLKEQLGSLGCGNPTPQAARSLAFAKTDMSFRSKGIPLGNPELAPRNHFSIPHGLKAHAEFNWHDLLSQASALGYRKLKLKIGNHLDEELTTLRQILPIVESLGLKVRFDANEKFSLSEASFFLQTLENSGHSDLIEWLEDPIPFEPSGWESLQNTFGVALAMDRPRPKENFSCATYVVAKPAIEDIGDLGGLVPQVKLSVTSYLDHPIGQCMAAALAELNNEGARLSECGLATHTVYETNEFSERLSMCDTKLGWPREPGIGFGDLLSRLTWTPLNS